MTLAATIEYFAELMRSRSVPLNVVARKRDAVWLGSEPRWRGKKGIDRLKTIDRLHRDQHLLRIGWHVVTGRQGADGKRVFLPLVSAPCRLVALGSVEPTGEYVETARPSHLSEVAPSELSDEDLRQRALDVGLEIESVELAGLDPAQRADDDTLRVVRGAMVYLARDAVSPTDAVILKEVSGREDLGDTAVAAVFSPASSPALEVADVDVDDVDDSAEDVGESYAGVRLTPAQAEVVRRAQTEPLTVVSGAPGTGKTLTIAAAATRAAGYGRSTLLVTSTVHAAEVIGDFLRSMPGPDPVRFGDPQQRAQLANQLLAGEDFELVHRDEVSVRAKQARERRDRLAGQVVAQIEGIEDLQRSTQVMADLSDVASRVPATRSPSFDAAATLQLLDRQLGLGPKGFRAWLNRRRLRTALGVELDAHLLRSVRDLVAAQASVVDLPLLGAAQLHQKWQSFLEASKEAHRRAVEQSTFDQRELRRRQARQAAALATALTSTSAMRNLLLAGLDTSELVEVFPIWVGTLAECEQVLPRNATPFDLVIVDEASQVAQPDVVAALARARRAVVCGDPHQLRHTSFIAGDAMLAAAERVGLELQPVHDVRGLSTYDAAAAVSAPVRLSQHFRSAPHLIGFNARQFYGEALQVMTVCPQNASADRIHLESVLGGSDRVDDAELDAALDLVDRLGTLGSTSIGLVSPFRKVVDALEERALDRWSLADLDRLGLQIGTVHGFQGSERDSIVAVLGLAAEPNASGLRWLQRPDVFNVMTSRAREEVHVVTRVDVDRLPAGLLRDYLRWADDTDDVTVLGEVSTWSAAVADALEALGHDVQRGYQVGPWTVDVVLPNLREPFGLECSLPSAGAQATLQRRHMLADLGWTILPMHEASWSNEATDAALYVAETIRLDRALRP